MWSAFHSCRGLISLLSVSTFHSCRGPISTTVDIHFLLLSASTFHSCQRPLHQCRRPLSTAPEVHFHCYRHPLSPLSTSTSTAIDGHIYHQPSGIDHPPNRPVKTLTHVIKRRLLHRPEPFRTIHWSEIQRQYLVAASMCHVQKEWYWAFGSSPEPEELPAKPPCHEVLPGLI